MAHQFLKSEQPDLYSEIAPKVAGNPALAEAVGDYEKAGARLKSLRPDDAEWRDWAEIRDELVLEIRRLSRASAYQTDGR